MSPSKLLPRPWKLLFNCPLSLLKFLGKKSTNIQVGAYITFKSWNWNQTRQNTQQIDHRYDVQLKCTAYSVRVKSIRWKQITLSYFISTKSLSWLCSNSLDNFLWFVRNKDISSPHVLHTIKWQFYLFDLCTTKEPLLWIIRSHIRSESLLI